MEHLYLGNYIKKDKIADALHYARIHGHLAEVEDREVKSFLEGFERTIEERHGHFQERIDHNEIEEIISIMGRDHADIVNDHDLRTIASVLLDKDFQF